MKTAVFLLVLAMSLWACSDQGDEQTVVTRWYTAEQTLQGQTLFQQNCASCHGDKAQGLSSDWRKQDAEGFFPPPPLNGTAHAWHHPLPALKYTIREGGAKLGGKMPAFGDKLDEQQQEAIIAYIQSLWSDEIYTAWLGRGGVGKQ